MATIDRPWAFLRKHLLLTVAGAVVSLGAVGCSAEADLPPPSDDESLATTADALQSIESCYVDNFDLCRTLNLSCPAGGRRFVVVTGRTGPNRAGHYRCEAGVTEVENFSVPVILNWNEHSLWSATTVTGAETRACSRAGFT